MAGMPDSDDLMSTQLYIIMIRKDGITLVEWTKNSVMIRALAAQKAGTKVSNVFAFKLWAGQVTNDELIVKKVARGSLWVYLLGLHMGLCE